MKRIVFLLMALMSCHLYGQQDLEEMMKKMQEEVNQEIEKNEKAVKNYISKNDSLFAEFLKNQWKAFDTEAGKEKEEKPKPDTIPTVPEVDIEYEKFVPVELDIPDDDIDTDISPEIAPPPVKIPEKKDYDEVTIQFYEEKLKFKYNKNTKIKVRKPVNDKSIPDYWAAMSRVNTTPVLDQINKYASSLALNDFGKYKLVKALAADLFVDDDNRLLFTWYLMTKLGYDIRVGYGPEYTVLMIPANNMLYSRPFLTINNQKYFIFNFIDQKKGAYNRLYTYDKKHPKATKYFDLKLENLPVVGAFDTEKRLKFKYQGKQYEIGYKYNRELVNYFDYYPQTDYPVYFQAPMAHQTLQTIAKDFRPILKGKSEQEALNILLRFVQTAFLYKTDDEHFGREKPLIPDETLFYEYSDCEDRAVLYSLLVKKLLNLDVVGLKYEGHMAVGVKTKSHPKGDYVGYSGDKYLVCDPTYINANIGQSMPKYKNQGITIIDF